MTDVHRFIPDPSGSPIHVAGGSQRCGYWPETSLSCPQKTVSAAESAILMIFHPWCARCHT
jgi:hypothetical protein